VEIVRDGKSPGKASDAAPLQKSIDASKPKEQTLKTEPKSVAKN